MPNIIISGSLSEVAAKLRRIKEVIANRVAEGYEPKQQDEEWLEHTVEDDNVCPVCVPLNGTVTRGSYILSDFPYYVPVDYKKVMLHNATNFHAAERCRCDAEWINIHETLVERLFRELEAV